MLKLRKLKIKFRLIISMVLTSLIPLIILGGYSSIKSSEAVTTKIETYSLQVMDQLNKNITNFLSGYEGLSDELMLYEPLQTALKNVNSLTSAEKSVLRKQIDEFINENYILLNNINSIEIFTKDRKILHSFGFHNEYIDWNEVIHKADEKEGLNIWKHIYFKGTNNIAIARRINDDNMSGIGLGYLVIILEEEAIHELYKSINLGSGSTIFIMDQDGFVVSSDNKAQVNVTNDYSYLVNATHGIGSDGILKQDNSMIAFSYMEQYTWYLIGKIPFSYIHKEVNDIILRIITLSIGVIIAGVIVSLLITYSITSPLNKLVKLINMVKKGKFHMAKTVEYNDEIGYLEKNFHEMRIQIGHLIDTVKTKQEEKRQAEINALQAQINPHFLFNTLNSIKWIATINQSKTIENGLESLATLLRNTIVDTNEVITLKEEVENINHYILLQKIRYGERIHIVHHIEEDLMACKVLKLILQPLVENAIIHGITESQDDGIIELTAERKDEDIYIHIEDNGIGFNVALLTEDNKKNKLSGIGINNVDERIKLNYGKDYGIHISSVVGKGTKVTMKMPYIKD